MLSSTNIVTYIEYIMTNQVRILGCILLVLVLSYGSETRPLNPTMVSDHHHHMLLGTSIEPPIAEEEGGKSEEQRLSPGGPDAHHH
jgi:hypothetical protein